MSVRSTVGLCLLVGAALSYAWLIAPHQPSWGEPWLEGAVGVVLGLFICSRPAANLLDALYRSGRRPAAAAGWWWPMLNVLAFAAGLIVIFMGAMQLTRAGAL